MPSFVRVNNLNDPAMQPALVRYCDAFGCRLRGLMFRPILAPDDGLLLVEKADSRLSAAIHMWFVRFDLAVFWINADLRVVDKVVARPWHNAYVPKAAARYTLEVHPDRSDDYAVGDRVEITNA
jgi:hypothetical protein